MSEKQIVTISFFRYQGFRNRWQAFQRMGRSGQLLQGIEGLQFAKMLGSGSGNGFSIWPNWGVYGLLGVWDDRASAQQFLETHASAEALQKNSSENWTVFMRTAKAHGSWDGVSPFHINCAYDESKPVCILTRATIKMTHLGRFWKFVPPVSHSIAGQEGLLFSVGIGELPLIQQATFSLWQNSIAMKAYAYESGFHKTVVRRTREVGWYSEELFARFHPFDSSGTWFGDNPLNM